MLSIGIVGLPNVGKSTLFNALLGQAKAEVSNYPFCTVDPNIGVVEVPDVRLKKLGEIIKPEKVTPAVIEFVDLAGLVHNAHKGEGLGNQFLAKIRECDAIVHIVRVFEDSNITHVSGKINPQEDIKTVNYELILKDLETISKRKEKVKGEAKSGSKQTKQELQVLEKIEKSLEEEVPVSSLEFSKEELPIVKELNLLTSKPVLYIANISEKELENIDLNRLKTQTQISNLIPICAKLESDLVELSEQEAKEYLESLGLKESGTFRLIKEGYKLLNLITFYTITGGKEVRAWPIISGTVAPKAAGCVHTDFEKGFIAADVIHFDDLIKTGDWHQAKEKGLLRTEGKDYIVCDGDVIEFKFNT